MRHPSRYADVPLSQRRHRLTRTPRRMGLGRLSLSERLTLVPIPLLKGSLTKLPSF